MTRREILLLAGVLLLQTVIVALVFTPRPHSGGDNAGYVALGYSIVDGGAYRELWSPGEPPHTKYPPVFPALLAGMMLLGVKSWATLKVVPAFSTILAVGFAFLWARRRSGAGVGVAVALLFGLSSAVVYYSQWLLSDPTFVALTLGAVWAFEMAGSGGGEAREQGRSRRETGPGPSGSGDPGGGAQSVFALPWLALALVFVGLAYFTRSAGLPLAVATVLWLGWRRRWRILSIFAVCLGLPAFLWWLRGRMAGGSAYVSEFWLVDPYRPFLGRVGPLELLARASENLTAYVGQIIPAGIVGAGRSFLVPLAVALVALGVLGWVLSIRRSLRVPELFAPLYLGLILLWPTAWSGDRFALPLFPFLFFYGARGLGWLVGSLTRRVRIPIQIAVALCVALPAGQVWLRTSGTARACTEATRAGDPNACLSPPLAEYLALASWSGKNLPDGAVVVTRKPRIFYVMSTVKAAAVPLTPDPDEFLARARQEGAHYLTVDYLDSMSRYYIYPVLSARPESFCRIVQIQATQGVLTAMLGITGGTDATGTEGGLETLCPAAMTRSAPRDLQSLGAWDIPLLVWGADHAR